MALLAAGSVSLPFEAQASHEQYGQAVVSIDASSGYQEMMSVVQDFSLVLSDDGRIFAAGTNQSGQLGTGDNFSSATPRQVLSTGVLAEKKIIAVSAGGRHALALDVDGLVYAWGNNQAGQLGDGTNTDSNLPVLVDLAAVSTGRKIVKIAAGPGHSAAIDDLGTVYTWGENSSGQLGDTTTVNKSTPVSLSGAGALAGLKIAEVSLGGAPDGMGTTSGFTVAVSDTGVLVAWGYNSNGELGDGSTNQRTSPVLVDALGDIDGKVIKSVSSGERFSVAIDSEGKAYAWGFNNAGQLGDGSTTRSLSPVAVDVSGVLKDKELVQVAAGGQYTLALADDGTVFAWGSNRLGQLGDGSLDNSSFAVAVDPATVLSGKKITAIAAGYRSSLALDDSGSVHGWGLDNQGQLGVGLSWFIRSPIAITPAGALAGKTIQKTSFGFYHTLFIDSAGLIYAAGQNSNRQLGDGTTATALSPVLSGPSGGVLEGKAFTAIAAGGYHSLALDSSGKVYGWGSNNYGQLGIGSTVNSDPTLVGGLIETKTIVAIAAGGYHSLALDSDGVLYSWGYNVNGQLGVGDTSNRTSPVAVNMSGVLSGKTISTLHGGDRYSMVLDSAGQAYAWGFNIQGELGDNSSSNRNLPVAVHTGGALSGKTLTQLSTGMNHILAKDSAGDVYAWGLNNAGQLGDGTTSNQNAPKLINFGDISGKTISSVAAGRGYSLALDEQGVAYAWGTNYLGQLGLSDSTNRSMPVAVDASGSLSGKTLTSLSTSFAGAASFAYDSDGALYGWGRNSVFDLSIGDTGKYLVAKTTLYSGHIVTAVPAPTQPDAPTEVVASSSGSSATVTYSAAASGGSAVTSYLAMASTGETCTSATTSCTFTGLANGAVRFSVTATNAVGTSDASALSSFVTVAANVESGGSGGGGGGGGEAPAPASTPTLPTPATPEGNKELGNKPVTPENAQGRVVNPVLIDGVKSSIEAREILNSKAVEISDAGWKLSISASSADGEARDVVDMVIRVRLGDQAVFSGSGMAPNTVFNAYVFSEPVLIGQVFTDEDGNFSGSLDLPAGLTTGFHALQLGSLTADGKELTASVAMELQGKVNAGSFNGIIALYSKGFMGQRLSAKVGEDWVIVDSLKGDYVRITEPTRWIGHAVKVRIFIDRKLMATIDLVTK